MAKKKKKSGKKSHKKTVKAPSSVQHAKKGSKKQQKTHPDKKPQVEQTSEVKETAEFKTGEKGTAIVLNEKIRLEKGLHNTYAQAINKRYGKYTAKVAKPTFIMAKSAVFIILFFALSLATLFIVFGRDLPDVSQLKNMTFAETTVIYDREGNILYRVYDEENRKYVPLSQISRDAVNGTLAIEDKNFYHHFGFDAVGMVRAQLKNLEEDDIKQGASTITQQLAKNIFLTPERTYERKIKEFLISLQIESMFSKDEILEMYLNKIAYGSNAYGIEAASKTFFGKSANNLTLAESAVLASLPKAPSYYSPYGQNTRELLGYCKTADDIVKEREPANETHENDADSELAASVLTPEGENTLEPVVEQAPPREGPATPPTMICKSEEDPNYVRGRKDLVLERMIEDGYITKEQAHQAWVDSFDLQFKNPLHKIESPHFVFYVKEYLEQKYGKELVESGGLEVVTTLDPKMQSLAEGIIKEQADINSNKFGANNAAMVALDPATGQVLAMVGSVNYWDPEIDGQVNVTTSPRQPGSSFKPLVYAAAVQNGGIGSGTILSDTKTTFERNYVPHNSDNTYKGKMTVRNALAQSRNIPAIKAFYIAGGEDKLLDFMDKIGVTYLREFKDEFNQQAEERGWTFTYGPAMAIGSGEIPLIQLVEGYSSLANGGYHMDINPILEIRDRDGNIIEKFEPKGEQAIDPQAAYIVSNILSDAYARPGGTWRAELTIAGHTVAAKTGTSNKKVGKTNYPNNLLTVGYTPNIAAAFWTGNTDGSRLYYNAWGLTASAPMWNKFMTGVLESMPDVQFPVPEEVVWKGKEVYPSFQQNTNYDKLFKSEEEEEEDEIEKDEAGVPIDTFVGEKLDEKTLDEMESDDEAVEDEESFDEVDILDSVLIPESDFVTEDAAGAGTGSDVSAPDLTPATVDGTPAGGGQSEGEVPYGF